MLQGFLLSSFSRVILALCFADKNSITSDNLNVFPTNSYPFSSAAYAPVFGLSVNNECNHSAATTVNLNIADKAQTASVGFVYNFFASQFRNTAIHNITPHT